MAITVNPLTSQIEFPVSARFDDFSGFLLEVDDDVVTEASEDAESADGVVGVDGVVVPPVPVPVPPGVTGGGVGRVARRYTDL